MVSYLRAANVTWRGISLGDVKQMHFSSEEVERFQLKAGDILLGEASGSASEVGKPAVWRGEIDTGSNPVFMHPAAN
jgi:type I restriction enzyme S subunit